MQMIKIAANENGSHNNQTFHGAVPDGWAAIPDGMSLENFPFGEVTAEEINGVMTVTAWEPGTVPAPDPEPERTPTEQEDMASLLVDHEYRLTLLELGITEGEV